MEVWWSWKERVETEDGVRFLIPESDPRLYEYAFDYIYETVAEAIAGYLERYEDQDQYPDWILVKETLEPFGTLNQIAGREAS